MSRGSSRFVGSGWGFPVEVSSSGGVAMSSGPTEIEQSIYLVLATEPGERPMRPEFGTPLSSFVFEPVNGDTVSRLSSVVHESLTRWEPRIEIQDIDVVLDPAEEERITISIDYRIRDDYDRRNLLVPFYVIPTEGEQ